MTNKEAASIVKEVFKKLEKANSINDIKNIISELEKNGMKNGKDEEYPQLKFKIKENEIEKLRKKKFITEDDILANDLSSKRLSALEKLLYAMIWKQGDLKKEKHIIQGIVSKTKGDKKDGLVFYHFGKHLSKKDEPIIDQHVLRAFRLYKSQENKDVKKLRQSSSVDQETINDYKIWVKRLKGDLKNKTDYSYYVDKLLFTTGKMIKSKKN